jgi:tRNA-Thr(GGU) m(6)t(6)A37 methyltransferase TsaA
LRAGRSFFLVSLLIAMVAPSSSSSSPNWHLLLLCSTSASIITFAIAHTFHKKQLALLTSQWQQRRQEERTGRIRAEVKLRTQSKEKRQGQQQPTNIHDDTPHLTMTAIGKIISPYTKRMGTPRQTQLVPSSRGYVQIHAPAAALDGIELYSHVWILWEFHANTSTSNGNNRTKIRPPRAPQKVGQLATRSPHRPNPIGLSLVKVECWNAKTRQLHVSGLDIVNGTPVYDIKPCVPWDIPGTESSSVLRVPEWVTQDDEIAVVEFTTEAKNELDECIEQGYLAPLYTKQNDGLVGALQTIQQVLAQDPRSSHKGVKENARGVASLTTYNIIFCKCRIDFLVSVDRVQVTRVQSVEFRANAYVDGVPLISENNNAESDGSVMHLL